MHLSNPDSAAPISQSLRMLPSRSHPSIPRRNPRQLTLRPQPPPLPRRSTIKEINASVSSIFKRFKGHGTVVTGRVEQGKIKVGEEVEILGLMEGPLKTTVTGVEMFKKMLDNGHADDNVGLLVRGLKRGDVQRGQMAVVDVGVQQLTRPFPGTSLHMMVLVEPVILQLWVT